MMTTLKIGAAMMARNAQALIGASIGSLNWLDGIYLYDDNSSDDTVSEAQKAAKVPIFIESSRDPEPIFQRGEMIVRNALTERAFAQLGCDVLVLVDSDELMSQLLRGVILDTFTDPKIDSLCFSIWHLFDENQYLHFWETHMNGVYMIDPHIRVIRRNKFYQTGFSDGSHPYIKTTDFTRCVHGPYHFHMKYHRLSPYPNYALNFLPKYLSLSSVQGFLRKLCFPLPLDVKDTLSTIKWVEMKQDACDYYDAYETTRKPLSPSEALGHPRDKQ